MSESKVNFNFVSRHASKVVSESLLSAGYSENMATFIATTLSELIANDIDLDAAGIKKINSKLLLLIDAHASELQNGDLD